MTGLRNIRSLALQKLAALSAVSPQGSSSSDFGKLCSTIAVDKSTLANGSPTAGLGNVPMDIRELETLVALCNAAPLIRSVDNASRLLHQISPYFIECYSQNITSTRALHRTSSSPWATMTSAMSDAIFSIGSRHATLREQAVRVLFTHMEKGLQLASGYARLISEREDWKDTAFAVQDLLGIYRLSVCILSSLESASQNARFWNFDQQLRVVSIYESILSQEFLLVAEAAYSALRTRPSDHVEIGSWKKYQRHYSANGHPLGANALQLSFMAMNEACAASLTPVAPNVPRQEVLSTLLIHSGSLKRPFEEDEMALAEKIAGIAAKEINNLDENPDYLHTESIWQQRFGCALKASSISCYLLCSINTDDDADMETLMIWLEAVLADSAEVSDQTLACVTLRSLAIMARISTTAASKLARSLPRLLSSRPLTRDVASVAAESLVCVLKVIPQDTVITTLYGLGNSLSNHSAVETTINSASLINDPSFDKQHATYRLPNNQSTISIVLREGDDPSTIYTAVILAIVEIAKGFRDETISGLALSILVQKVGKINALVDMNILTQVAVVAVDLNTQDFRALLRLYVRITADGINQNNESMIEAVLEARDYLSRTLKVGTPLFDAYLEHLLETLIAQGESHTSEREKFKERTTSLREMTLLFKPLATVLALNPPTQNSAEAGNLPSLQRDAWYNIAVHGFTVTSIQGKPYAHDLRIFAQYTYPLVAIDRADRLESDIELNTVLRRGRSSPGAGDREKEMAQLLSRSASEIGSLSYPELMFLRAAHLVETLRARSGDCTRIFTYFVDPQLRNNAMGACMGALSIDCVDSYLRGGGESFSAPYIADQMSSIFEACCHRIGAVQKAAYHCAERLISQAPSALCQKKAIFSLLDLLTIMWASCLEAETDEYEWKSIYTAPKSTISLQLSDDYEFRRLTLRTFHSHAKKWVMEAMNLAPLDIKGLLQTYLSDYGDDEAFGHLSLGRSFALEMGSKVPLSDHRLGSIDTETGLNINTASDFMAQYTTRQEYRYTDPLRLESPEESEVRSGRSLEVLNDHFNLQEPFAAPPRENNIQDMAQALLQFERGLHTKADVPLNELRDTLRKAASLLCRSQGDQTGILGPFVRIPFVNFTKHTIKFGLSLWMGVIKENPRMESRILVELAECWMGTIRRKLGVFSPRLSHVDPFYVKEEFAPSDHEYIQKQQQRAHDLIAPHYRILQFLSSHYNATRLTNSSTEQAYLRILRATLDSMRKTPSHPLAREVHFQLIELGLEVVRLSRDLDVRQRWKLKDALLSAALAWFANPPRWTFGGNRLQVKAEVRLLNKIASGLKNVSYIGAKATGSFQSLQGKQDLLQALLANEQSRLLVWLFPMESAPKHHFSVRHHEQVPSESIVASLLKVAWNENPSIAVQMLARYQTPSLTGHVKQLILSHADQVINDPDALVILLGTSLGSEVASFKYLLYWAPVNPITAVTYFLPAYGNHPLIIQYAVRALEHHSVDVTFFYVPQIVQTLRYDVLGYVERYIIETAKFSQLFAHQIIWNMKANAFKDEDSEIPDPVKPTLDKVTHSLISSFSQVDKAFYEREFTFFNEITGISGKLRPFIKRPKPEKKAKIEEELRQIQVEVGVYLPSNPDGVVVGIDRKSGKPLQSHAKAPYMATFRIRKERQDDMEATEEQLSRINSSGDARDPNTYEVWQSAIFKVGDDCRQDVLALQMIAAFRGIFHHVGLPVYVFPYRVTATAPGCGVIDVLPNSISRDMLGREAVNGLYDWFISKFGGEDAPAFQAARANFVRSLAAYSVISYFLQFKDRHNGNIMFDEAGHILHIDFGFCFDIAPGGVKFERAPFKLTKEMVAVLGGNTEAQAFRWFEELVVKDFLASRPFIEQLCQLVTCMLDSGLPCFKPETMKNFRDRFVLERNERDAAEHARYLVRKSYLSNSTKVYDEFQLLTNGIPY